MQTEKKVILSSFHTCSPFVIEDQLLEPDVIISLDSHLDTNLLGYRESVVSSIRNDTPLFYTAARAATHAVFRRQFENSDLYLVLPEISLSTHVYELMNDINTNFKDDPQAPKYSKSDHSKVVKQTVDLHNKAFNLNIMTSPPKDPVTLISQILRNAILPVLDIDIDYFSIMQTECYTPLKGAKPNDLGNLERVTRLIRGSKPALITISEAKVKALQDPNSQVNAFLEKLKNMGYTVERFFVFESDSEAEYLLRKWERFNEYVQRQIQEPNTTMSNLDDQDLSQYAKAYFGSEHPE